MTLRGAPLLYVFYETASLEQQRHLFEDAFGLPIIENQFHPPHEFHGLVKYDAGKVILSLNLSRTIRFRRVASDGMVTVFSVGDEKPVVQALRSLEFEPPDRREGIFTDAYGHHYVFRRRDPDSPHHGLDHPTVEEFHFLVRDLEESLVFYEDILGLTVLDRGDTFARLASGTVDLVLRESRRAPDGRPIRHNTYLVVFYTGAIEATRDTLVERGLERTPRVGASDIGQTARVIDPTGHIFCLYQPSEESMGWGSGAKVRSIVSRATGSAPVVV